MGWRTVPSGSGDPPKAPPWTSSQERRRGLEKLIQQQQDPAAAKSNQSTEMFGTNEELVRAQMSERLGEARERRRANEFALAQRWSRRAERAAQQARLALARTL